MPSRCRVCVNSFLVAYGYDTHGYTVAYGYDHVEIVAPSARTPLSTNGPATVTRKGR